MRNWITLVSITAALSISAGCGSGSGAGDGNDGGQVVTGGPRDAASTACRALSPAGAVLSWQDNGTPECASAVVATRKTDSTQDFLEIVGGTSTGTGVGLSVVGYGSALGGTYTCKGDGGLVGGAGSVYVDFVYTGKNAQLVDCTITIATPGTPGGANAVGTFSATLTATAGGTITIANGTYDTPVTGT